MALEVVVSAWMFSSPEEADASFAGLANVSTAGCELADGAKICWPKATSRPTWAQVGADHDSAVAAPRLDPHFWSLTVGLLFYVPLLKARFAESNDPLLSSDPAIDRRLVNRLRDELVPGTTALMIVGSPDWIDSAVESLPTETAEQLYEFTFSQRFADITEAFIATGSDAE